MNIIKKRFGEKNPNWNDEPRFNNLFLRENRNYWNTILERRGYVLLKDVYDSLGIGTTRESCVLGWFKGVTGEDCIKFDWFQLENDEFELIFECYPILKYLDVENVNGK